MGQDDRIIISSITIQYMSRSGNKRYQKLNTYQCRVQEAMWLSEATA